MNTANRFKMVSKKSQGIHHHGAAMNTSARPPARQDIPTETEIEERLEPLFSAIRDNGLMVTPALKAKIRARINDVLSYEPKIGILGKTGVGKSSLCNALFGQEICEINDIEACTRKPQEVLLDLGHKGITLVDVPGVGESVQRDQEYRHLYSSLLPSLDMVIWLLKADDRAYATDEKFYTEVVKPHLESRGIPFLVVINQVDKIEPFREWDTEQRQPGSRQAKNIESKRRAVSAGFGQPLSRVVAVSASPDSHYNLVELVDAMVHELPDEKKASVFRETAPALRSPAAAQEVKEGLWNTVKRVVVETYHRVVDFGCRAVSAVKDFFSSFFS